MPTALITGITGQDGSYLAEHLLEQGYRVVGMVRRPPPPPTADAERGRRGDAAMRERGETENQVPAGAEVVVGDLLDPASLERAVRETSPDEIYHLAAVTFVPDFARQVEMSTEATTVGVLRLLEAARQLQADLGRPVRFCQASSAEMFGYVRSEPQNEQTPLMPRNTYGLAKTLAHTLTEHYRQVHGLFACAAILFSHESPRRGPDFVTRKITRAVARIKLGRQRELALGNLDAVRDWGYAPDYVRAMHLMLQSPVPDSYVVGTGELHSVRDFLEAAFGHVGLDWRDFVTRDERFYRPPEAVPLRADATRARNILGWQPTRPFDDIVREMVDADLARERVS